MHPTRNPLLLAAVAVALPFLSCTAVEDALPSSSNNVKDALISLGAGEIGGRRTLFLGGTTPEGDPLPVPAPAEIILTAVTSLGDSVLDTARYAVKPMNAAPGALLALSVTTDYSGSMADEDVEAAAEIYRDLFTVLDTAGTRFESNIYRFSDTVTLVSGFTSRADSLRMRMAVDPGYERGSTSLYDAVGTAIVSLSTRNAEVKALIVTTDGLENSSVTYTSAQDLYDLARQHKVRVFMLGTLFADLDFLRTMSRQSGGLYVYNGEIVDVKAHALRIHKLLAAAIAVELKDVPAGTDSVRVRYGAKTVAFDL